MTFTRGDIVLVPFQFSEKDARKHRPAVILSADGYHASRADILVAAVTTRIRTPLLYGDSVIQNWQACGLPRPSVATAIIRTLKQQMIVDYFGRLTPSDQQSFDDALRQALSL